LCIVDLVLKAIEQIMNKTNTWDKAVIKMLVNDKGLKCDSICNAETLYSLLFDSTKYPAIRSLIEKNEIDNLKQFDDHASKKFSEYLDIIKFADQDNKFYLATIYDSMEVWQDPIILDIFPI